MFHAPEKLVKLMFYIEFWEGNRTIVFEANNNKHFQNLFLS